MVDLVLHCPKCGRKTTIEVGNSATTVCDRKCRKCTTAWRIVAVNIRIQQRADGGEALRIDKVEWSEMRQ
jgi:DNA replicative helicase MCM subunit Mcm2 (Cdc46/Mcm family)